MSKIFWKPVKIRGKYSIGGYPKILGNLIPKFFGVKYYCKGVAKCYIPFYHCRWWTKCPIPMLLLHTFSMRGDYVDDSNKIKTTLLGTQGSYQNSQGGLRENRH